MNSIYTKENLLSKSIRVGLSILPILFTSCFGNFVPDFDIPQIEGYKPIYAPSNLEIVLEAPIPFSKQGKIYHYSHYIFVEEIGRGFHIIENADNTNPTKVGFFQIPLNTNIAVSGNIVYANSGPHLLALKILEDGSIITNKLTNVFSSANTKNFPPASGNYFECVDEDLGEVVGWKLATIKNPKCYY